VLVEKVDLSRLDRDAHPPQLVLVALEGAPERLVVLLSIAPHPPVDLLGA
jgi:hypothetical protein